MNSLENINISAVDILCKYLAEIGISQNALAKNLGVPATRIHEIIRGRRKITPDTDLRLCKFFGHTDGYFLRLQDNIEVKATKQKIQKELENIVPYSQKYSDMAHKNINT
jgi:addiction module HigA family antidote